MSTEYQNLQLDGYNFDDYFNALISPVQYEKKPEIFMNELNKYKDSLQSKLEYPNIQPHQFMNNTLAPINYMQQNMKNAPNQNSQSKTINKRKSLAETSRDVLVKQEQFQQLEQDYEEETESSVSSSPKKSKKNPKTTTPKKKKEAPKRKRVNYCFEIHRSGCQLNKDSKLYCKVFLKGKLQSEVDLIKGARGKWAYTFYDQRKDKKERRYWPSQSSGPVIEDPCSCDKCIPSSVNEEEVDFSSPSTEDATLIEYENPTNIHGQDYQQIHIVDQNNNVYYTMPPGYHSNEIQEYQYCIKNSTDFQNIVLKSSNDFQQGNQYYQVSNDFIMNQRVGNWEGNQNVIINDYQNDNFFSVENNFL